MKIHILSLPLFHVRTGRGDLTLVRRSVALFLICVLAFSFFVQLSVIDEEVCETKIPVKSYQSSYTEHVPFNITSDADFVSQAWPGNGSESDPYLIENLNITSNSSACIWIMNTTSHFRIQNCLFKSPIWIYVGYQAINPVTLTNVTNGVVYNNRIVESHAAIGCLWVTSCLISNNQFNVTTVAISMIMSNFSIVYNNTQETDHCYNGIWLHRCENITISYNRFGSILSDGLSAYISNNCTFINNTFIAPETDIHFPWSGISLQGCLSCQIIGNSVENFHINGMEIFGQDLLIEENIVIDSNVGILLHTNNSMIRTNNITECFNGIEIVKSNHSNVYSNLIRGDSRYQSGIALSGGSGCNIYSNEISDVGYGIIPQGISGFNISYNTVTNSRYGMVFGWFGATYPFEVPNGPFSDCDIIGNIFDGGGLFPTIESYEDWDFDTIQFEDNTVNGRLIGLFANLYDSSINGDDYGQLHLVNCDLSTIYGGDFYGICSDVYGPYSDPGQASAITLVNCSRIQLLDVEFHNNTIGVNFQFSRDCILWRGSGYYNSWTAVILWHSEEINIVDIEIRDNLKGVGAAWSFDCEVYNSLIWRNDEAVNLVNCMNFTLLNNHIFQNDDGVFLGDSDGCDIRGNSIHHNSRGILFNSSSDCVVHLNEIYNNTGVGIVLDRTSNRNEIFHNAIAYNSPNAICEGSSNSWDDGIDMGNWWSDFIGDGPYIIDENDQDNFPIDNRTIPTTPNPLVLTPEILVAAGGIIAVIALGFFIYRRRQVTIID